MAENEIVVVHSSDLHLDVPYTEAQHADLLYPIRVVLRTAQAVGADLVTVELAARGPRHNQRRSGQQDQTGRSLEREAADCPPAEERERKQVMVRQTDITNQHELPRYPAPTTTTQ